MRMKTDFHDKDLALSLTLKWRLRWTRKWPIVALLVLIIFQSSCRWATWSVLHGSCPSSFPYWCSSTLVNRNADKLGRIENKKHDPKSKLENWLSLVMNVLSFLSSLALRENWILEVLLFDERRKPRIEPEAIFWEAGNFKTVQSMPPHLLPP